MDAWDRMQVDRTATPWLMVTVHAAPYHTYVVHYKEMDCWLSIYEDMMYEAGVVGMGLE